jgi:esterase/lipase superfamily enzyme
MLSLLGRIALAVMLLLSLEACSPRPGSHVLTPVARVPSFTKKVRVLVATTRSYGSATDPHAFTSVRSDKLNYAAVTVSIPRHHKPGEIEWPDQVPADPSRHFVTTARDRLTDHQFLDQIRAGAREKPGEQVLVFVHGFNTRYEEAVYWLAQFVHDSGYAGTAVLFAWPSMGKAPMYLADREASTYSRDYLEQALLQIAALKEVREIDIVAHSMGNWLAVETLRQAKLKGHGDFRGKLGEVVLASPDLDVSVFRTQLDVIAPMRRPITILVSRDDKALSLSTTLAGGIKRAGVIQASDPRVVAAAARYNLNVIDLTAIDDGSSDHHSKFSRSSAVVAALGRGLSAKLPNEQAPSGLATALGDIGEGLVNLPAAVVGAVVP